MPNPSSKRPKRPTDPLQLAKAIGDIATGEVTEPIPTADEIRRVMVSLGRAGGLKGGKARAKSLSKKRKSEIASLAAKARWRAIKSK